MFICTIGQGLYRLISIKEIRRISLFGRMMYFNIYNVHNCIDQEEKRRTNDDCVSLSVIGVCELFVEET